MRSDLTWRSAPPDRPGWWWTRSSPGAAEDVVEVHQDGRTGELLLYSAEPFGPVSAGRFHTPGRQWSSGPLTPPAEPQEAAP